MIYIISIALSTIILFFRIKTNIFERITKFVHSILENKKLMQGITRIGLILIPAVCYSILFYSSNTIVEKASSDSTGIVTIVEEDHYWLSIIDFLKNCILLSPVFWFTLFFLYQNLVYYVENTTKKSEENNNKKVKPLLFNMQISVLSTYITIVLFTVCIYISNAGGIFEIKALSFFREYFAGNIELYSKDTLLVIIILLLGLTCHFMINLSPIHYLAEAFNCHSDFIFTKTNKNRILGYKLLLLIPVVNIFMVYLIKGKLSPETGKRPV